MEPETINAVAASKEVDEEVRSETGEETEEKTLTEFILFPKLPLEIRNMIWSTHCAMSGRLVALKSKLFRHTDGFYYPRWAYNAPVPSVLQVCRESRLEGLRSYELSFPTMITWKEAFPPRIFYNDFADTLYLTNDTFKVYIRHRGSIKTFSKDMKTVKSLAIDTSLLGLKDGRWVFFIRARDDFQAGSYPRCLGLSKFVKTFKRLERLDLMFEDYDAVCREMRHIPGGSGQTILQKAKNAWSALPVGDGGAKQRIPPEIRLVKRSSLKPTSE